MSAMTRRQFLVAGAAAGLGLCAAPSASRAATVLKVAHDMPVTHPIGIRAQEAATEIKSKTAGRVQVQMFSASVLGSEPDMLSQLRAGAIDIQILSPLVLQTLVPLSALSGVPFAFRSYADVWHAVDGDLGKLVNGAVAKTGIEVVGRWWNTGFREFLTGRKPINGPADLAGLKIRVPPSPLSVAMFRSLGASPTSISFGDVYSALQTGIVDGMEINLSVMESSKLYEVQKHIALVNYMWDGVLVLANSRSLGRLPAAERDVVVASFDGAGMRERADVEQLDSTLTGRLPSFGLAVTRPDPGQFAQALQKTGFYTDWQKKFGDAAWATLGSPGDRAA